MESYWSIALTALIYPVIYLVFPVAALSHLRRHEPQILHSKLVWAAIIILSWVFYGLGAIVYGLLNFRSGTTKIIALVLVVGVIFYASQPDLDTAQLKLIDASVLVDHLPPSPRKNELVANLTALDQEVKNKKFSQQQKETDAQLGIYLRQALRGGMSDAEFQEWRSVFYYRNTIDANYVKDLIQKRGFNDPNRRVIMLSPGELPPPNVPVDTLFVQKSDALNRTNSILHYFAMLMIVASLALKRSSFSGIFMKLGVGIIGVCLILDLLQIF